jgi:hypothetical protein
LLEIFKIFYDDNTLPGAKIQGYLKKIGENELSSFRSSLACDRWGRILE